jgi:hypothetical protein
MAVCRAALACVIPRLLWTSVALRAAHKAADQALDVHRVKLTECCRQGREDRTGVIKWLFFILYVVLSAPILYLYWVVWHAGLCG